ncbi:S1 RNA-binding domain-containing protein 1 [Toxocara canis]|uniref:S1 RNA-binding domain-containing protein 1 n=1 Tax=Toxocara canis TaxID=6265 RepID=A0A0B2VCV9_TOXCA|nr:S1 RNA-binding domain-containing protein 1 [Toxocara canis]
MPVQWTADEFLSAELGIEHDISRRLVSLFEEGNEIAFIARYRRHLTGGATPDDLRHALDAFNSAKAVKAKAEKLIKRVESEVEDAHQKASLKHALSTTMDAAELDTLFEPFKKTKKGTLASRASELGVHVICQRLYAGECVNIQQYVIRDHDDLNSIGKVETEMLHFLSNDIHRMEETQSLIQKISELKNHLGIKVTVVSALSKKAKSLKEGDKDFPLLEHFKLYTSFDKDARFVQDFQILALERAASKGIVSWKVRIDERIGQYHPALNLKFHAAHLGFLKNVIHDSTKRFLIPSIERNIKRRLVDKAERSAIDCFAKNVRELLLTAPLRGHPVLAIDPGYSNGCKCALVSANGEVLDTGIFYLVQRVKDRWEIDSRGDGVLKRMAAKCDSRRLVIAVGNGTASRPAQCAIASLIDRNAFAPVSAKFCVVSECGASIYSATELAAKELPNLDINIRSAVSLARRVIDPISEYVKIAPKHLGVGSYQHSVNEKRLDEMLDIVVRECVSSVGVNVNVASVQLLQKVSGLNKKTAANILKYRQENGKIVNREVLKEITGIGPRSFEQCAGFLFIYDDDALSGKEPIKKKRKVTQTYERNPLDSTAVHPESYHTAKEMISLAGCELSQIGTEVLETKLLSMENEIRNRGAEWILVWELLTRPVLKCNPPQLLTGVLEMNSLHVGQVVNGVISNHAQFGVFVDIGVGFNALAHHTTLPPVPPPVNAAVRVKITNLELQRRRIAVVIL